MGRTRIWVMAAMLALALMPLWQGSAQAQGQGISSFPRSKVEIVTQSGARHGFTVELATTFEQLSQGLMYRRTMAADAGMLFDFGEAKPITMWMKNTLIPLDMVFLAGDGRVMGVAQRTVPGSLEVISSPGAVRGVLEINGGTAERLGIRAGDRLIHPIFAK
ncbi:MAG: DUF192 domain-containing protein [Rhodospirillaceae bacterium]|nr:DUF192 domain-containing protein [Rhodospirillales bacterium]